jgi:hypothetical protein
MGEAARVHAADFTWEQTGRRFAAVLDQVTGTRAPVAGIPSPRPPLAVETGVADEIGRPI